ncbi:cytochrome c oxidase subunit 4 isoform 1, mitochondrial [Drosophila takahashii]|uniref:cytochrome c oxidase subunit 4 isoform 1, mitochondrial n=1 Tax=Drosophila takahashii TaxID=29030 RepID=UPI0007E5CE64|nr:cytochrome c oxidase subunit 4 isoform 1, mitochondrial [Drosophila takahashii]XP_016994304.1 cytochrome c oxidase subunit 4 isoform 1, mitochondrial [Drosophila takahashii]XP_016994305.1 cytochrome c oxidase subunit 4 isoform 1, mitochondrial [Drosophila takahashii]
MALRLINSAVLRQLVSQLPKNAQVGSVASVHTLDKIGKREIVGYGWNGTACYADRVDYPLPAVRFREPNNEINALRTKEQGDWKKLSPQEIKALYRASFCQTIAEVQAGTGEWKLHLGVALLFCSAAIWVAVLMNLFVYDELPVTFDEEHQKAQLQRIIDLEINPVTGLTSNWDYENKKWKN